MRRVLASSVLGLAAVSNAEVFFKETFDDSWKERWVTSNWKQSEGSQGDFVLSAGKWGEDKGIQTSQDARFYAISAKFPEFSNKGKPLVIQFSVKHQQKIDCGGGYVKVFPAGLKQESMTGDSEYNIMFGPDICGGTKRTHIIFNYGGENFLIKKTVPCEYDELTHVYTLIVKPDNTYEARIDGEVKASGSLEEDWEMLPPKEIEDPDEEKPSSWVDDPMMDDPEDVKPEGYDDIPQRIADPEAEKPDDWDDEDDGEWEPPMIANPEYKGPWSPKRIANPDYKGPWVHPKIPNPDFVADENLYAYDSFGAIGIDVWQVKSGTIFDNIIITDSIEEAESFMAETYGASKDAEKAMFDKVKAEENAEAEKAAAKMKAEMEAADEDDSDDDDDDEAPSAKEEL